MHKQPTDRLQLSGRLSAGENRSRRDNKKQKNIAKMGSDLQHIALTYQLAPSQVIYELFTGELGPDGRLVDEISSAQHIMLARKDKKIMTGCRVGEGIQKQMVRPNRNKGMSLLRNRFLTCASTAESVTLLAAVHRPA